MKLFNVTKLALTVFVSLLLMSFDDKPSQDTSCSALKSGWFKMPDAADTTSYVVITSSTQTEYYNFKRYWVRSSIKWISDCECELTVTAVNYPGLVCKRGDKMSLRVLNKEGDIVNYEVLMDGSRERARYLKMDNTAQ